MNEGHETTQKVRQNLSHSVQPNDLIHLPTAESALRGWALNTTPVTLQKQMAGDSKKILVELIRTLSPT